MSYERKTHDEYCVMGDYGNGYGFEELCRSLDRKEALDDLKAYRQNAPEGRYTLKKVRVKN